jgi:hypothetical protein
VEGRRRQPKIRTPEDTISLIRRLAVHYPDAQIAGILNRQHRTTARGLSFTASRVASLRTHWHIPCHKPGQEKASAFPICATPQDFARFFTAKKDRGGLYDSRAREAFRAVQPFANLEEVHKVGVALDRTFEDEVRWSELHRLDTLWNIDKHRRLTLMAWWPNLIYWGSDGPSNRRAFPGDGTLANGSILLYIEGTDEGQGDELSHDFNLVMTDDPAFSRTDNLTHDLVAVLESWHQHIVELVVFPHIFTIMSRPKQQRVLTEQA